MPGFWRVTVVYGLGLILTGALVLVASAITLRSGAALIFSGCMILALVAPALVAGMSFGRHFGRAATPPEAWRYSGWFAAIQGLLLAALLGIAMQEFLAQESDSGVIMGVILCAYVAAALPVSRFSFGVGAGQAARTRFRR
ncbi:ABZJ_00895 family protein [Frigidibacter sp. RF13]|uniref:ABZJ_00895 family protein n=1 Tax=Frigidibacter sp. RF13 TaxID=2997340 RepID=UPI00226DD44F|nr:ABZJ_00895 family protein [Frigidibacter sp. RF13]